MTTGRINQVAILSQVLHNVSCVAPGKY